MTQPKRIKPIHRNGFEYDGTSFTTITGFAFESPEALRNLCRRRALGRPPRRSREGSSASVQSNPKPLGMSREFIVAQHRFYGIPVLWQRRDNYVKIFRDLVNNGRFCRMSREVEKLRTEMIAEWNEKRRTGESGEPTTPGEQMDVAKRT